MVTDLRKAAVMRRAARTLAAEIGRSPEIVLAELEEAVDAGLLRVTRNGVQAAIPDEVEQ